MSNIKYALALGGGSARGLVHIGVLKYLEDQHVEITEVAGTSMGALIGAAFAIGYTIDDIEKLAKEVNMLQMVDFDIQMGVLKGEKVYKYFEKIFKNKTFEETTIPLKITATDIETGKLKVFTSGKIADAVRASVSLPGIFKPHEINGTFYIDGGVTCNLPVDQLKGEKKIAVSGIEHNHQELKLKKKIFGFEISKSFWSINFEILYRSTTILMAQNELKSIENSGENTQVLFPTFGKLTVANFDKVDEFKKIGYDIAKKELQL